jgi:hypothetical protein
MIQPDDGLMLSRNYYVLVLYILLLKAGKVKEFLYSHVECSYNVRVDTHRLQ